MASKENKEVETTVAQAQAVETTKTTILEKLFKFQAKALHVGKGAYNPFFKSNYAALDYIQEFIQPHLTELGLGYYHAMSTEGMTTVLFDTDGNTLSGGVYPMVLTGKPQEIGSAVTYAKRYSLVALLGLTISDEDDDGNVASGSVKEEVKPVAQTVTTKKAEQTITSNKGEQLMKLANELAVTSGKTVEYIVNFYRKTLKLQQAEKNSLLSGMLEYQADAIISSLTKKVAEKVETKEEPVISDEKLNAIVDSVNNEMNF